MNGGNGAHRLLGSAYIAAPAGSFLLHQPETSRNINGGDIKGSHFGRVQFHAHLAVCPTDTFDRPKPGHTEQPFGDGVIDKPAELLVVQLAVRGCCRHERQHRASSGRNLGHRRVAQFARQIRPHPRDSVAYIVYGFGYRFFQYKLNRHIHNAVEHFGEDIFYALQRSDGVFDFARDIGL